MYIDEKSRQRMAQLRVHERDLEETFSRSSGPGGQNVNKVSSAATIRHVPSGLSVTASDSRSQSWNRQLALERLLELFEKQRAEKRQQRLAEASKARRQKAKRSRGTKRKLVEGKRRRGETKKCAAASRIDRALAGITALVARSREKASRFFYAL